MRREEKINECILDIYRAMYKKAEPSADFDKLMESGVTIKPNWFMNYTLAEKEQLDIIDAMCKKYKLNKNEKRNVSVNIHLGCAPKIRW